MSHFSAAQWFEFARGATLADEKAPMESHVKEGCDECRKLLDMWTEALDISRRESQYQPPAEAVRSAKAAFVPEANWRWFPQIAQTTRLIFDSLIEPVPSAVRGATATTRQFLQEAQPFVVDLRVDYGPVRGFVRIIGQVLNSAEPNKGVENIELYLLKGEELATRATANASGEFALEFEDVETRSLFADIGGQRVIEIRLPAFSKIGEE